MKNKDFKLLLRSIAQLRKIEQKQLKPGRIFKIPKRV